MSWRRKRRRGHEVHEVHEGGACPDCGESQSVIAARLKERVKKVMAGAEDAGISFGLPCGCVKEFGEPVKRCKEHVRTLN